MEPGYRPPFELIDFLSLVERRAGSGLISEATVKIRVGEEVIHTAGSGNGPVNALDVVVRTAADPSILGMSNHLLYVGRKSR